MAGCLAALNKAFGGGTTALHNCCLPLTEYDEKGNRRWRISVTIQNGSCCRADYTCREGDAELLYTRFCLPHTGWNNTVPECSIAETTEAATASTALNHVAIPGALLGVLIVCMMLFIVWWRRQAVGKGRSEDERTEEDTDNIRGNDIHNIDLEDIQITTHLDKDQSNGSVSNESALSTQFRNNVHCYSNGFIESDPYKEGDFRAYSNSRSSRTNVSGSDNQLERGNEAGEHVTSETKL